MRRILLVCFKEESARSLQTLLPDSLSAEIVWEIGRASCRERV